MINTIKMANFKVVTLNINGMTELSQQELLIDFLQAENITCCLIQEHNLKYESSIYDIVREKYDIFFNATIKKKRRNHDFIR